MLRHGDTSKLPAMSSAGGRFNPRSGSSKPGGRPKPHRGGIQKNRAQKIVKDADDDLIMSDGPALTNKGRRRRPGRAQNNNQKPMDITGLQNALIKGIATGDAKFASKTSTEGVLRELSGDLEINDSDALETLVVKNWKKSKASSNRDGGVASLLNFLEKKVNRYKNSSEGSIRIKKSRVEGSLLLIWVKSKDVPRMLKLNNYNFAGTNIGVEPLKSNETEQSTEPSPDTLNVKQQMTDVLSRRYNITEKFLNLSALGADPQLSSMGLFVTSSRRSKFFPALMKVCDSHFATAQEKKDAITSVSLANNQLQTISEVTALSQTFPHLKNLDLSDNQLKSLKDLQAWRWKFRRLDHLILTGNPIESTDYQKDIVKWFPRLRILNSTQVRTDEELALKGKLPIATFPPVFLDQVQIAENFLKNFFSGYDTDRVSLANRFCSILSKFSLDVNVQAPTPETSEAILKPAGWDKYIKKNRNILKINYTSARMAREFRGAQSIGEAWNSLPRTRHPDLVSESAKWLMECHPIAFLPDPTGASPAGVSGLMIVVHGQFDEVDAKGSVLHTRSFDRTFILGPGQNSGEVAIVSDILVLRAYGGSSAWVPDRGTGNLANLKLPDGFGEMGVGKREIQVQQERMMMEVIKGTGMTPEYTRMLLEESEWDLKVAEGKYESAKPSLPAQAFL